MSAGRIEILRCLLVTPPASCDTTGGLEGSPRDTIKPPTPRATSTVSPTDFFSNPSFEPRAGRILSWPE